MPKVRRCRYPGCHAMAAYPAHYCQEHYEHEAEYLAKRQRWARAHAQAYEHKYNTQTRNRTEGKREQYNFYRTKQWQDLRRMVLNRDSFLCRYCQQQGMVRPGNTVDHTIPYEFDPSLATSSDNLVTVCRECHRLKTQWEQSYYGTGKENSLKDVPKILDIAKINNAMRSNVSR